MMILIMLVMMWRILLMMLFFNLLLGSVMGKGARPPPDKVTGLHQSSNWQHSDDYDYDDQEKQMVEYSTY